MKLYATAVSSVVAMMAMVATGQAIILEVPPPDAAFDRPSTFLVSGDGQSFTALYEDTSTGNWRAYLWSPIDGFTRLEDPIPGSSADTRVAGMSEDGQIVVGRGNASGLRGLRWINSTSPTIVSDGNCTVRSVTHANADGNMFVGEGGGNCFNLSQTAYRWVEGQGFQALGRLPGASGFSASYGISADGTTVVGVSSAGGTVSGIPFIWDETGGLQPLELPSGFNHGFGMRVTNGGATVFGEVWPNSSGFSTDRQLVRWIDGQPEVIQGIPTALFTGVRDITHDGGLVVGSALLPDDNPVAYVWTESTGMLEAADYFAGFGLDLTGWELTSVQRVSALGDVFVGIGYFNGEARHWVVDLSAAFPPVIDTQPAATTLVDAGQSVELSVSLRLGTAPIAYEWRRNGQPLSDGGAFSGTATPTLLIQPALPGQTDVYDVVVTNDFGEATSTPALVAVREGCSADFDGNGELNFFDFAAFVDAFNAGCP